MPFFILAITKINPALHAVRKMGLKSTNHTHSKIRLDEVKIFSDMEGGIGIVEMLFRCNILALVGGGEHPKFPLNKVLLWDDHQLKCIGELTFKSEVVAVKLRKDRILVALDTKLYLYNFADLKLIDSWETNIPNPKGICVMSSNAECIIAYPDKKLGHFIIRTCSIAFIRRDKHRTSSKCT